MGRKRAERAVPLSADVRPASPRREPAGARRVALSYLGASLMAALAALGYMIADPVAGAVCNDADASCPLGISIVGVLLGGLLGASLVAAIGRFGWEWWLVCATAIVAAPALLDLLGAGGWLILALAPLAAGVVTLSGRERTGRPVVIGSVCAVVLVWALLTTFVLG